MRWGEGASCERLDLGVPVDTHGTEGSDPARVEYAGRHKLTGPGPNSGKGKTAAPLASVRQKAPGRPGRAPAQRLPSRYPWGVGLNRAQEGQEGQSPHVVACGILGTPRATRAAGVDPMVRRAWVLALSAS